MTEQIFPNTFAPNCENTTFTAEQLKFAVKLSFIHIADIPLDILDLVFPKAEPDK